MAPFFGPPCMSVGLPSGRFYYLAEYRQANVLGCDNVTLRCDWHLHCLTVSCLLLDSSAAACTRCPERRSDGRPPSRWLTVHFSAWSNSASGPRAALTDSAQLSERRCQGHNLRHCRREAWTAADDGEGRKLSTADFTF